MVLTDGGGQVCQERTKTRKVNRISFRSYDLMGENLLTVVLVLIEAITGVERLTVNQGCLDRSIEKILDRIA
jgi:hypothetical protein